MNKGIKVANGEYYLFLNSGDWLIDNYILDKVFKLKFDESIVYRNIKTKYSRIKSETTLRFYTFFFETLLHQASFIKKNFLKNMVIILRRVNTLTFRSEMLTPLVDILNDIRLLGHWIML